MMRIFQNADGSMMKCQFDNVVNFNGQTYMARTAHLFYGEPVLISEIGLEADLFDESAGFTQDNEASRLDRQFYAYVGHDAFTLEDSEFDRYVQDCFETIEAEA